MKKMRMAACVCVGSIVTVLIWHFICGCQSPARPGEEKSPAPTPEPAPETREVLIRERIIEEAPAPAALPAAPAPVREVPAPTAVAEVPAPTVIREAPAAARTTYRVEKGDTLWSIARRFQVSVAALQKANGIVDSAKISVGQELVIPSAGGGA